MKRTLALVATAGIVASANAQLSFDEIAVINLDAAFNNDAGNGTNPSAVAWDGTNLFVAGFNGGTAAGSTQAGIVPVSGALSGSVDGTGLPFGHGVGNHLIVQPVEGPMADRPLGCHQPRDSNKRPHQTEPA